MATTYTLIASTTLGSNTTSNVTFSSIPSTYTDLVFRCAIRKSGGSTLSCRINSDSATNYSDTSVQNADNVVQSNRDTSATYIYTIAEESGYTANTFGSLEIYIPNYTATTSRAFSSFAVGENNSASANRLYSIAHLYRGTSAISSFSFVTQGDTYYAGSTFYLYGVKNS